MHYFLIAGEASGDLHASHLMAALRQADASARFTFFGGDMMAAVAGSAPVVHYRDMAYMGFSEVLRNLDKIGDNLALARRALAASGADALVLVDYPSFNLKVAATAARLGIPVYYYISPKIWAWKKWRIRDIRRLVEEVYAILPFEPEFYRRNGAHAVYVGNPSVAEVDARLAAVASRGDFLERYGLSDRPLVALMPGSRYGEIRNNLPAMNLALRDFAAYSGVIVGAPSVPDEVYAGCGAGRITVVRPESAVDVLAHCRAAMVTSGTATLETALVGIPQVVTYRANGVKLSYDIMKRLLSVDYVSLPNLIVGREIIPEQLVHLCTPDQVAAKLGPLLDDTVERRAQLEGYAEMRRILGTRDAATTAAADIVRRLGGKTGV